MKHILTYTCLLLISTSLLGADKVGGVFEEANEAYQASEYDQAIMLYDSIISMGFESAGLYYNLGNAHYKIGNVGPAILNYEKALQLQPDHRDAQFNLRLANLKVVDNIERLPELLFSRWGSQILNSRSSGQWAVASLIFLWTTLFTAGLLLYSNNSWIKRLAFTAGIVLLIFTITSLVLSFSKLSREVDSEQAIIFAPNSYVKSAPDGQSTDLFILHEGVKVNISEESQEWVRIELPDGKDGWIPKSDIAKI